MNVDLLVVFDLTSRASHATKTHYYPVVPQVGDYVQLPGFGELAAKVFSRVIGEKVTLQFRELGFVNDLESYGWKVRFFEIVKEQK